MAEATRAVQEYAALQCVDDYTERKRVMDLNRIFGLIREENATLPRKRFVRMSDENTSAW